MKTTIKHLHNSFRIALLALILLLPLTETLQATNHKSKQEDATWCYLTDAKIIRLLNELRYEVYHLEYVDECTRIAYTQYYPQILVYVYLQGDNIITEEVPN